MSLERIRNVIKNLHTCNTWSVQLLNISSSEVTGVGYACRKITLHPKKCLDTLIEDIQKLYSEKGKKSLAKYRQVREYDDTADADTVYRLSADNEMIRTAYRDLLQAIAEAKKEEDPFAYNSAYLLIGEMDLNGETVQVKLFSMQTAVSTLRHKFLWNNGAFETVPDKVISLRPAMDVIIIGSTVYFLTAGGEKLFDMERAYKSVCRNKVELIQQANIIHGMEHFAKVASSGHNPKRFLSFDPERLKELEKKHVRLNMASKFSIPLDSDNDKFDATAEGAAEKIVKLLCKKGMTDPFSNTAVEVDGARRWM